MEQGLYEQIINNITSQQLDELDPEMYDVGKEKLDAEEARKLLSTYLAAVTRRALKVVREQSEDHEAVLAQVRTCNEIMGALKDTLGEDEYNELRLDEQGEVLTYVYSKLNHIRGLKEQKVLRPATPLSQSSLFTGSHAEPNMMHELQREIVTSDEIDLLVSFIKWSGIRCLMEQLQEFTAGGGRLRVITTTYMEATDYKAVVELSKLPNTCIQISYDTDKTRLHAKAYIFKRNTGFTTAYVGSSNLSNPALTSGLEWNVKVTEKDSYDVLKKIEATFESYWNDREFKPFEPENETHEVQLKEALNRKKEQSSLQVHFELTPFDYQREVLEKLEAQRTLFGRYKNLLVAATGVGKTVISAFDYKRFCKSHPGAKLLFVAHREEILQQSRDTFRVIMQDWNFGELHVGVHQADALDHLFISIQSFNSLKLTERTSSDFYDYIIVDEFHHAAAPSYQKLLTYYKPEILLGLTATPERMDGRDIVGYFDGHIAAEIRLTDAIDRKLLCPFQYFGVTDTTDLSQVKWSRKGYDLGELEKLYTHNKIRTTQIMNSLRKYVTDLEEVKGLGFCVSVEHALYMAKVFNETGIPSLALHGNTGDQERKQAKGLLVSGEIKMIFVVDLYNEGVDIPEVNTILFLRPTESLTVFLQQLGRGLRLAEGKECLTVLDFIGQAHKEYNFQDKFRALLGRTKHSVKHYVEQGFSSLPRGTFIQLEKQAKDYILGSLKQATNNKASLINRMKYFTQDTGQDLTLDNFVQYYGMSLYEVYGGRSGKRFFRGLMVEAEVLEPFEFEQQEEYVKRIPALLNINSRAWLKFLLSYIKNEVKPQNDEECRMLAMFYYTFYRSAPEKNGFESIEDGVARIMTYPQFREEIVDIFKYNAAHLDFVDKKNEFPFTCPIDLHCSYTMDQVLAGFGYWNEEQAPTFREGVKYFEAEKTDIFFITLNKSDKDFSPSTLYEDYAINEVLFHWQPQSRVTENTKTAQRYIHHRTTGNRIALFVREYKEQNGYTSPFVYLGEADYVSHTGGKPMNFVWQLREAMPPQMVATANKCIV
ncbi:Helicase conserved C-terminal domain-containing protein [Fontibacillus panacisegetis]|uniref:Helicase conserved C-terminal domain-containing protein n=1 Tax=Fontibacillus panacisegetis TaxID=670482 RepID=A0A1G7K9H4_9BACL|nr:DEAD/DEAH box helicase [Fontibacillus panacisegetis]SDF33519.1 Helicase conserved C-terminal domain-containing protein [Fontibacillus panacisegetis]